MTDVILNRIKIDFVYKQLYNRFNHINQMKLAYVYSLFLLFISCQPECLVWTRIDTHFISYWPASTMIHRGDPLTFGKLITSKDTAYGVYLHQAVTDKEVMLLSHNEVVFHFHLTNGQIWQTHGYLIPKKFPYQRKGYELTSSKLDIDPEEIKQLRQVPIAYLDVDKLVVAFKPAVAKRIKNQVNCLSTVW